MQMNDNRFNVLISLLNMFSFLVSTAVFLFGRNASYINLELDVYGTVSTSFSGYWILLGCIPVFAITYILVSKKNMSTRNKGFGVCLVEFIAIIVSLPNFQPFPNPLILGWGSVYAFMTGLTIICYYYGLDAYSILSDTEIVVAAKIERVRLEFETWFRGLLALVAFVAAVYGLIVTSSFNQGVSQFSVNGNVTKEVLQAALAIQTMMQVSMLYFCVLFVILGVIMIKKITSLSSYVEEIKEQK